MKLKLFIATVAVLITSWFTHVGVAFSSLNGIGWAFLTAIVLGIINLTIKPIISIISIPINLITLGLFSFVVNGAMILVASHIVAGFHIPNLLMAIYFSLILGAINWFLHLLD